MTVPTITALPEIPAYSDANFETKAPAVLSALRNTFVAEMNAAIAAINSYDYGAAVNISKVVGLTAGYIPYGAGTAALASSANFVFSSNRLDLTNPSGAQARLTHSSGKYTDFKTDGDGNLTITPSGQPLLQQHPMTAATTGATNMRLRLGGGAVGIMSISETVAASGTVSLYLNNTGGANNDGIVIVRSFRSSNPSVYTATQYAFMSRGTNYTATVIGTKNGTGGAVGFTLSMTAAGVLTATNSEAYEVVFQIKFIGG